MANKNKLIQKGDECELIDETHIVCKTAKGELKECDLKKKTCKRLDI